MQLYKKYLLRVLLHQYHFAESLKNALTERIYLNIV